MARNTVALTESEANELAEVAWKEWRKQYDFENVDMPWVFLSPVIKQRWREIASAVVNKFVGD